MRLISSILLLLIIALSIAFAALNPGPVTIHYYFNEHTVPFSLFTILVFIIGSLLGWLIAFPWVLKARWKNYQLNRRLKVAEKEIANLRHIPLKDKH